MPVVLTVVQIHSGDCSFCATKLPSASKMVIFFVPVDAVQVTTLLVAGFGAIVRKGSDFETAFTDEGRPSVRTAFKRNV